MAHLRYAGVCARAGTRVNAIAPHPQNSSENRTVRNIMPFCHIAAKHGQLHDLIVAHISVIGVGTHVTPIYTRTACQRSAVTSRKGFC